MRMDEEGFVDHVGLDWSRVVAAAYRIDQTIRYDYSAPIRHLRHRLVIAPRAVHGDQRRLSRSLVVSPDAATYVQVDAFGNDVDALELPYVERSIAFALRSNVVRDARLGATAFDPAGLDHPALHDERRLTEPDAALRAAAARLRAAEPDPRRLAEAIARFVHAEMVYTKAVTDVFTTAAQAFAARAGVCQDYAHVTLALARACGLTARYVSGHLIGDGASHAWVEILIPERGRGVRVLSLDPTHGRPTDLRYLVIAVGRDYEDVAPTSGVFSGSAPGRIGARQVVRLTDVTLAA
jgi:transglutaminase-like putative cysteine protease